MKLSITLILYCLFLFRFTSFAQQNNNGKIVIINQFKKEKEILIIYFNSILEEDMAKTIQKDSSTTIYLNQSQKAINFNFNHSYFQVLLYGFPGDTIIVTDGGTSRYLFKGKRANEWNFMANLETTGYPLTGINEWDFGNVQYGDYLSAAIKKRAKVFSYFDSIKDSLQFSMEFNTLLKRDLEYAFISYFIRGHRKYSKPDSVNFKKIVVFLEGYKPYFHNDYLPRNSWVSYYALTDWNAFLAPKDMRPKSKKKSKTYFELLGYDRGENFENRFELAKDYKEPVKSQIMYDLITFKFYTDSWGKIKYESYVDYFLTHSLDSAFTAKIASLSGTYLTKLDAEIEQKVLVNPKTLATKMTTFDGKTVSWESFLKQHKGKTVYLDFWATWCGPCKREFKESRQNISQITNPNIVFVNISVDEDKAKWRKTVKELKFEAKRENFLIDFDSPLAAAFIPSRSVPQHAIIDKKGSVRTLGAPVPSSIASKEILEKLSEEP